MHTNCARGLWPYVPIGNGSIDTLNIVRGEGVYLYTENGRKLLDGSAGAAVGNIGWGRSEVSTVAAQTLERLTYTLPLFVTPERLGLVDELSRHWLPAHPRISFCGSGSEANDLALRVARLYQKARGKDSKWKIIGRDVSYHGTSLSTLAIGDHSSRRSGFEPFFTEFPRVPACYCLRCPFGLSPPGCNVKCARQLQAIIDREGAESIAAFIAEPIVGTSGGALVPPGAYWAEIAEICRDNDILLISDEVLTGFGRSGAAFALNHWDIESDIIVLGKGLSGGYASIAGVATKSDVATEIAEAGLLPMYNTYSAHPQACASAAKVLEILRREELVDRVATLGTVLQEKLLQLADHPNVAQVRGRGFLHAIEIVQNRDSLKQFPTSDSISMRVMAAAMRRGVLIYPGGTGVVRDIVNISPAFIIEEEQMDQIVSVTWDAISEVCSAC